MSKVMIKDSLDLDLPDASSYRFFFTESGIYNTPRNAHDKKSWVKYLEDIVLHYGDLRVVNKPLKNDIVLITNPYTISLIGVPYKLFKSYYPDNNVKHFIVSDSLVATGSYIVNYFHPHTLEKCSSQYTVNNIITDESYFIIQHDTVFQKMPAKTHLAPYDETLVLAMQNFKYKIYANTKYGDITVTKLEPYEREYIIEGLLRVNQIYEYSNYYVNRISVIKPLTKSRIKTLLSIAIDWDDVYKFYSEEN